MAAAPRHDALEAVEAVAAAKAAGVTIYVAKPFTYIDFSTKVSSLAKQIIKDKAAS